MHDQTLLLLAEEVRGKTLRLLAPVREEEARWTPPGMSNSIIWHAGHAYILAERLGIAPATAQPPQEPENWFDLFSWTSRPSPNSKWPPLADVVAKLNEQFGRLTAILRELSPTHLDIVIDQARNRTLRYSILHGLHDEADHQGEIWLLRKMYARRT